MALNFEEELLLKNINYKDYLKEFGIMFYNSVKELIDRNAGKSF